MSRPGTAATDLCASFSPGGRHGSRGRNGHDDSVLETNEGDRDGHDGSFLETNEGDRDGHDDSVLETNEG